MATYIQKENPVDADPYTAGMEDGFNTFTSATVDNNPIPPSLQKVALFYVVKSGGPPNDAWTCSIPYITVNGQPQYILPTDYILTGPPKTKQSKAEFEAEYETGGA